GPIITWCSTPPPRSSPCSPTIFRHCTDLPPRSRCAETATRPMTMKLGGGTGAPPPQPTPSRDPRHPGAFCARGCVARADYTVATPRPPEAPAQTHPPPPTPPTGDL